MLDLDRANTSILSEEVEGLRIVVKSLEVDEVLIDGEEGLLLRGGSEKNASISSLNGVLDDWGLVIWGAVYLVD